jgi:hypothetical protein
MPTRLQNGEGRTDGEEIDKSTRPIRRGSWARHAGKVMRVTGETRPIGGRGFTVACGGGSGGSRTGAQCALGSAQIGRVRVPPALG